MEDTMEYGRRVASAEEDVRCLGELVRGRRASNRQLHVYWEATRFLQTCAAQREAELDATLKLQVEASYAEAGTYTGSVMQEFRWMLLFVAALIGVILLSTLVVAVAIKLFTLFGALLG